MTSLILIIILMAPYSAIGLFFIIKVLFLPMKAPADKSNRIAHLRLVWWSITRPEEFVKQFPWLARDEKENLKG